MQLRALYRSGRYGYPIPQLKGKLDLIFARAGSSWTDYTLI
jgi:hypothetical protein